MPKCPEPDASLEFNSPKLNAKPCEFELKLPEPKISVTLPPIPDLLSFLPKFRPSFKLSCNLDEPIDVSANISPGGGRFPCAEDDPDLEPE